MVKIVKIIVPSSTELGSIILGSLIGKKGHNAKYIAVECPDCKTRFWARVNPKYLGNYRTCLRCSGINNLQRKTYSSHGRWTGGRIERSGYIFICLPPDSPFLSMAVHGNYVYEHRLVMAQQLNRPLLPNEIVHHINLNTADNRIENLQLLSHQEHRQIHCKLRKQNR